MSTDADNQSTAVFDRKQALEGLGDDLELLSEMAELFLEDIDRLVEEVCEAVGARDALTLRRSAHQLKGSASNFHAASTVQTALRLERMGQEEDLSEADEAFESLVQEVDRLKSELEKLTQS